MIDSLYEPSTAAVARQLTLSWNVIDEADMQHLTGLCDRSMRLQCLIQDGELQVIDGETTLAIRPHARMGRYVVA